MANMITKYLPTTKITYIDVMIFSNVSERTAKSYLKDIKEEFGIKKVFYAHYCNYFKIEVQKSAKNT